MDTLEFQQLLAAIMTQNVLLAKATVKKPGGGEMDANEAYNYVGGLYLTVYSSMRSTVVPS